MITSALTGIGGLGGAVTWQTIQRLVASNPARAASDAQRLLTPFPSPKCHPQERGAMIKGRARIGKQDGEARYDDRGRLLVKSLGRLDPAHAQTYFIRCGEFVKIGYGQDPVERMYELQPHNPFPMTLLAVLPGGMNTERKWHRDYAVYRHAYEWFRYEGELRAAIDALSPYEDPRRAWQRQQMAAELA